MPQGEVGLLQGGLDQGSRSQILPDQRRSETRTTLVTGQQVFAKQRTSKDCPSVMWDCSRVGRISPKARLIRAGDLRDSHTNTSTLCRYTDHKLAVQDVEGLSQCDVSQSRRPPRPSSAWKSRNRRPRFTDNFDAFDDPVIDLDIKDLTLANAPTATPRNKQQKDQYAWQDNAQSSEHLSNELSDVTEWSNSRQVTNTSSEDWTSCDETNKRNSVELAPDFELSNIRAKVLEKYRGSCVTVSMSVV